MTASIARLSGRLRQIAIGPVGSIVTGVGATNALRLISTLTLTRLLDSHAYGVVGVITSISFALVMLTDVGTFDFVVRHKQGTDQSFLNEVWTIRLIRGLFLAALMASLSGPAANLLHKPELQPVIAVWSLSFIFDGLSSMAFVTAVRAQQLWRLSMLDLAANVTQFVVSLTAAIFFRTYWALIAGMLCGAMLKSALSYVMFPSSARRFSLSPPRSRELWKFSRYIAMSSFLSLLILQSDKVVLARLMSLADYGLYAIATTLATAALALAAPYVNRVLLPAYVKAVHADPASLRAVFYGKRRKVTWLYMALVGATIGLAPLIIALLYDPRYRGVTPFLQLLSISALVQIQNLSAKQALVALGYTRSQLVANVARIAWLALGAVVGIVTGNVMLLVAFVGTVELAGLLCYSMDLRRRNLLDVREEALGFVAAGVGLGFGFGVTALARAFAPALLI